MDDILFFGPDQDKDDEFIKKLEYCSLSLTVEEDLYDFLGVEFRTDK